jgi:hypothetical protein
VEDYLNRKFLTRSFSIVPDFLEQFHLLAEVLLDRYLQLLLDDGPEIDAILRSHKDSFDVVLNDIG